MFRISMVQPRYTIAQSMAVVLLIALGSAVLTRHAKKKAAVVKLSGRFALIGKIDVDRDGKDDRDELKHMIEEAGGVIDFDLPPPDVGKELGTLSSRIHWYVTDDRLPIREGSVPNAPRPKRMRAVLKEARLDGIRPMPVERLLGVLGYGTSPEPAGVPSAVDIIRRLLKQAPREASLPRNQSKRRAGPRRGP